MNLGEFEELVLLAILKLGNKEYGVPIRHALAGAGREVSVGALYVTLDRLESKGYIEGHNGEATPARGGRPKRYFSVTGTGQEALRRSEGARAHLRLVPTMAGGAA